MSEQEYRRHLAQQRQASRADVDARLDRLCVELGYPAKQWRHWRAQDNAAAISRSFKALTEGLSRAALALGSLVRAAAPTSPEDPA